MDNSSKTWEKSGPLLLVLLAICFFALPAQAKYGGGTGEPNDPYLIYTAGQMNEIGLHEEDWNKQFKLMADIDLGGFTGTSFNIIGYYIRDNDYKPFTGVFDGNGHTISNFTYSPTSTNSTGVFGYVSDENAEIKNLGLIDPYVYSYIGRHVGSLVGLLQEGAVTGCWVEGGSIEGDLYVGGLVGASSIWGLITKGTITNCYSTASVSGNLHVGGLVGLNYGSTITNCSSSGIVSGERYIGGLVGQDYKGTITTCYSTAPVTGEYYLGGLLGYNSGGTITNCYAISSVEGGNYVGGLVGQNGTSTSGEGVVTNCYSAGSVSGDYCVGGLVGYKPGYVVNSFWDIEKSGQAISAAGEGRTTSQMMMADTFLHWGACGQVWTINEGVDYPRLAREEREGEPIVGTIPFEGDGVVNNPYLVYTAEELNAIRLFPCVWDKHFKLMANIDLSQYTGTEFNIIVRFSGSFDGNGHTISNFTYISTEIGFIGLFGDVFGEVKNLGLIDPNLDAEEEYYVGLLVGLLNNGAITNCYVEGGSVSGHYFVGELVGFNNDGTISECYSTGSASGSLCVGGLVGRNDSGTISKSYSIASVSGDRILGVLAGENKDTISNCYAMGSVSGNRQIGGLVGYNWKATVTNCYATASVSGSIDEDVGGLVGYDREGSYTRSFWDSDINPDVNGMGSTTNPNVIGESTTNMQTESTFTDAGWDFTTPVWTIDEGVDYPRLWWECVPVLHAEPEVTLGTSNTIFWEPVPGANDYYAECAEDVNFTSIIYNTGWITETSYTFTGLQLGQRYWYSVKARNSAGIETCWSNVESSLQGTLADAVEIELTPESLKNKNLKNALLNKINAAQEMIADGLYEEALDKLENDILTKMNGCAETGEPDKNDWIITCEGQSQLYPLIIEAIENVKGLMNQ
jgi:hypothetical protein